MILEEGHKIQFCNEICSCFVGECLYFLPSSLFFSPSISLLSSLLPSFLLLLSPSLPLPFPTSLSVLSRGRSFSPCYRFMSRWGDWVWVRSKSYMLYNPISHLPEGIAIYTWIVRLANLRSHACHMMSHACYVMSIISCHMMSHHITCLSCDVM